MQKSSIMGSDYKSSIFSFTHEILYIYDLDYNSMR